MSVTTEQSTCMCQLPHNKQYQSRQRAGAKLQQRFKTGCVAAAVPTYTCIYTLHTILHLSKTYIYCTYATITLKHKIDVMYSYFIFMEALHDHLFISITHTFIN